MPSLTIVVLCGGAGARLWPMSRELYPKQFLGLTGPQTLFQETILRGRRISERPPLVICNEDQRFVAAEQLREIAVPARIVLEPARRDSAPAIAAAAEIVRREDPDGLLLVLPSDHALPDHAAFAEAVRQALPVAEDGSIVTFGLAPSRPAPEFGYIRPGRAIDAGKTFRIAAFIEKPDSKAAAACIRDGCLWNGGMLLFRARDLLDDLAAFEPDMTRSVTRAVDGLAADGPFERLGQAAFLSAPAKSIDFAVLERTGRAAVLPVSFAWSDVGNWSALWEIAPHDPDGNTAIGPVELLDVRDSYIRSDARLTAVVGLAGVIVVAAEDAVLVTGRDRAQDVKDMVARLKAGARPEVATQAGLFRPWGLQQSLDQGAGFAVKRLVIRPGATISLHRHRRRSEHWVVVRGSLLATLGEQTRIVHPDESVFVPAGVLHRLVNPGTEPAEVIEVRTGTDLGEDDIERVDDAHEEARCAP